MLGLWLFSCGYSGIVTKQHYIITNLYLCFSSSYSCCQVCQLILCMNIQIKLAAGMGPFLYLHGYSAEPFVTTTSFVWSFSNTLILLISSVDDPWMLSCHYMYQPKLCKCVALFHHCFSGPTGILWICLHQHFHSWKFVISVSPNLQVSSEIYNCNIFVKYYQVLEEYSLSLNIFSNYNCTDTVCKNQHLAFWWKMP